MRGVKLESGWSRLERETSRTVQQASSSSSTSSSSTQGPWFQLVIDDFFSHTLSALTGLDVDIKRVGTSLKGFNTVDAYKLQHLQKEAKAAAEEEEHDESSLVTCSWCGAPAYVTWTPCRLVHTGATNAPLMMKSSDIF